MIFSNCVVACIKASWYVRIYASVCHVDGQWGNVDTADEKEPLPNIMVKSDWDKFEKEFE